MSNENMDQLIKRINELANKKKNEGLNEKEQLEQDKLRKEYLENFKANFKKELLSIKVIDEKGNDVTPKKLKNEKSEMENDDKSNS